MIKINLAPEEELENKYWFVPHILVVVLAFAASNYVLKMYLADMRSQIAVLNAEKDEHQKGYNELRSKQEEFKARDAERVDLQNRLVALQRITESKILRYRPVILLEHLQNLKPEGIWFSHVKLLKSGVQAQDTQEQDIPDPDLVDERGTPENIVQNNMKAVRAEQEADQHEIKIIGRAFDNILVAEFLSALKSTQTQEIDPTSLRTMVYFSDVQLSKTSVATEKLINDRPVVPQQNMNAGLQPSNDPLATMQNANGMPNAQGAMMNEQRTEDAGEIVTEFEIVLKFRERQSPVKNQAMQTFSFKPDFGKKFVMY